MSRNDDANAVSAVLSPALARAGRSMLGWSLDDLAARAHVTLNWLEAFEQGREPGGDADPGEAVRVRRALEEGGLTLLGPGEASTGGGEGLRLRQADDGFIPVERLSSANDV